MSRRCLTMTKSTRNTEDYSTPAANLAALGLKLQHLHLFDPLHQQVHIAQKTVRYTLTTKLYDDFIALVGGAQDIVEIDPLVGAEPALEVGVGQVQNAKQSMMQQTRE